VLEEFDLTASGQTLLRLCCESLDRVRQAQAEVARHGLVMDGAIKRLNPAHRVETDAKKLFLAYWRELGLDLAPPLTGGR
jgi:phage terminase small subunit